MGVGVGVAVGVGVEVGGPVQGITSIIWHENVLPFASSHSIESNSVFAQVPKGSPQLVMPGRF